MFEPFKLEKFSKFKWSNFGGAYSRVGFFDQNNQSTSEYAIDYYNKRDFPISRAIGKVADDIGNSFIDFGNDPIGTIKNKIESTWEGIKNFDLEKSIEYISNLDRSDQYYAAATILFGLRPSSKSNGIWTPGTPNNSVKNAFGHWTKHKGEFPELNNALQYVQSAQNFITNPPKGTLTKVRTNGDILMYNQSTNIFAINRGGVPATYFKPKDGINYFNGQK